MSAPSRDEILDRIRTLVGGERIVRWAEPRDSRGDYDGADWTIDIFDVPADESFAIGRRIGAYRRELSRVHRVGLVVVTHTPEATARHYAWVRAPGDHTEAPLPRMVTMHLVDGSGPGHPAPRHPAADFLFGVQQ